jgi:hypothetical protein
MDYIKIDLQEVGWGGMDWTDPAQALAVGVLDCSNEPLGFIKCREILD